jgi:hypothetical protein
MAATADPQEEQKRADSFSEEPQWVQYGISSTTLE